MNLNYLYYAVSWVLLRWHELFTAIGLPKSGGLNWALSIVFLVVTARVLLFRFFIKQVHSQRKMQEMQPKIKKLQEKHKNDKATLQREMMALQREEGFNPISGCLPIFLQLPIFISLFHVLKHMSAAVSPTYPEAKKTLYGFTKEQTMDAAQAKLFHAPLAASLRESAYKVTHELGGNIGATRLVIILLVIISAGATLITQRAVIANQTTPAEGQAAMIQKLMLFGIPASVVFSGLFFPLGVLLYWFSSNLWTMGQQFYIFRFHPHTPGAKPTAETSAPAAVAPRPGVRPDRSKRARPIQPGKPTTDKTDSATGPSTGQPPGDKRPPNKQDLTKPGRSTPPVAGDSQPGDGNQKPGIPPGNAKPNPAKANPTKPRPPRKKRR